VVGELEEEVKSLRNLLEVSKKIKQENDDDMKKLQVEMEEQNLVNAKLEAEIALLKSQKGNCNVSVQSKERALIKLNKLVLRKLKDGLRLFLEDTAHKDNFSNDDDATSSTGIVLQTLWSQFLKDPDAWVDVDGVSYDVPEAVLHRLFQAGVVLKNPDDANQIKLENFTMMD